MYEEPNWTTPHHILQSQTKYCLAKLSYINKRGNRLKSIDIFFFGGGGLCPSSNFLKKRDILEAALLPLAGKYAPFRDL